MYVGCGFGDGQSVGAFIGSFENVCKCVAKRVVFVQSLYEYAEFDFGARVVDFFA